MYKCEYAYVFKKIYVAWIKRTTILWTLHKSPQRNALMYICKFIKHLTRRTHQYIFSNIPKFRKCRNFPFFIFSPKMYIWIYIYIFWKRKNTKMSNFGKFCKIYNFHIFSKIFIFFSDVMKRIWNSRKKWSEYVCFQT